MKTYYDSTKELDNMPPPEGLPEHSVDLEVVRGMMKTAQFKYVPIYSTEEIVQWAKAFNEHDKLMLRSVGAMAIAEGEEGLEKVPIDCPMLESVSKLREKYDALQQASEKMYHALQWVTPKEGFACEGPVTEDMAQEWIDEAEEAYLSVLPVIKLPDFEEGK